MQRIGFDRMIKLDWIEYYAKISRHEEDTGKLKEQMHETLFEECPQMASRKKNITILQRIWTRVEAEHRLLRRGALNILDDVEMPERLALHWGMSLLAYPFFERSPPAVADFSNCRKILAGSRSRNRSQPPGVPGRLWNGHSPGCWRAWWIGGHCPMQEGKAYIEHSRRSRLQMNS